MKHRKTAPMHTALPATLLGDIVYKIPKSSGRVWVRGLIVLGVIGAVVGLTVAKYVTDDTLRNDVYIERKTSGITAFDAQNGVCPCQRIWLSWGLFMNPTDGAAAALQSNAATFLQTQCARIVDTSGFGNSSSSSENKLYARTAATNLCFQTMATIVPVILNQTNTDTLTSPSLLTPNATQRAYEIYVGNTVVTQLRAALLAYDSLATVARTIAQQAQCRASNTTTGDCALEGNDIGSLGGLDAAATVGVAGAQGALAEVSFTVLDTFGGAEQPGAQLFAADRLREFVGSLALADWEVYKSSCNPLYCDVFRKKDGLTRATEFLAVIGGLWNSCLFVGIVLWTLIMIVLRFEDHTYYR